MRLPHLIGTLQDSLDEVAAPSLGNEMPGTAEVSTTICGKIIADGDLLLTRDLCKYIDHEKAIEITGRKSYVHSVLATARSSFIG